MREHFIKSLRWHSSSSQTGFRDILRMLHYECPGVQRTQISGILFFCHFLFIVPLCPPEGSQIAQYSPIFPQQTLEMAELLFTAPLWTPSPWGWMGVSLLSSAGAFLLVLPYLRSPQFGLSTFHDHWVLICLLQSPSYLRACLAPVSRGSGASPQWWPGECLWQGITHRWVTRHTRVESLLLQRALEVSPCMAVGSKSSSRKREGWVIPFAQSVPHTQPMFRF